MRVFSGHARNYYVLGNRKHDRSRDARCESLIREAQDCAQSFDGKEVTLIVAREVE